MKKQSDLFLMKFGQGKAFQLVSLIVLVIILSACKRALSPPNLDSQQIIPPTQSKLVFTPTIPVNDHQNQAKKTITPTLSQNPRVTITPTYLSVSELVATPTIQVPLPKIQGNASQYKLTNISPETLIKLQLSRSSQALYSNTPLDSLLDSSVPGVINFEWERSYAQAGFHQELIDLLPSFYDHSRGRITNRMLIDLIGDHVIEQINLKKIQLSDGETFSIYSFTGSPYQVIDQDETTSKWIIKTENWDGFYLGEYSFWISTIQTPSKAYRRIDLPFPWQNGVSYIRPPKGIITDLTGDGRKDVGIIEEITDSTRTKIILHVGKGGPGSFEPIQSSVNINQDRWFAEDQVNYEWVVSPTNGLPSLVITTTRHLFPWNCNILDVSEYQWPGGIEQEKEFPEILTDAPLCYIAKTFDDVSPTEPDVTIQYLTRAKEHSAGLPKDYQAFVTYRLALLYALKGDNRKSQEILQQLREIAAGTNLPFAGYLVKQIDLMIGGEQILPYKLCLAAEAIALDVPPDNFISGSTRPISYPYKGYPSGFPEPLCDTRDIQNDVLNSIDLSPGISPQTALEAAGFDVKMVEPVSLKNGAIGWLLVIEDTNPDFLTDLPIELIQNDQVNIFRYIPNDGWQLILGLPHLFNEIDSYVGDITGDGIPEISLLYPYFQPGGICPDSQSPNGLFTITAINQNTIISYHHIPQAVCDPENQHSDVIGLLVDKNGDGISDWIVQNLEDDLFDISLLAERYPDVYWVDYVYPSDDLHPMINKLDILYKLRNQFFHSPHPGKISSEIIFYRDRWGMDDEIGRIIRGYLNYLLAIHYELEGDSQKAVAILFDIWQNQPETIWAYLASHKLELIE